MKPLLAILIALLLAAPLLADEARALQVKPVAESLRPGRGSAGLFIGVNHFDDEVVHPLRFAVNDAVMQAHLFVHDLQVIPAKNCALALSGEPTMDNALAALDELKKAGVRVLPAKRRQLFELIERASGTARGDKDLLIVSVSSHGFEEDQVYLAPSDLKLSKLEYTSVPLAAIHSDMEQSLAGKKLLFLDACRNNPRADDKSVGAGALKRFHEEVARFKGEAVITSCSEGEQSFEASEFGHGIFTHFLLEGLKGQAKPGPKGYITLDSVADYIQEETLLWTRRRGQNSQTPSYLDTAIAATKMPLALPLAFEDWRDRIEALDRALSRAIVPGGAFTEDLYEALLNYLEDTHYLDETALTLADNAEAFLAEEMSERRFVRLTRQNLPDLEPVVHVTPAIPTPTPQPQFPLPPPPEEGEIALLLSQPQGATIEIRGATYPIHEDLLIGLPKGKHSFTLNVKNEKRLYGCFDVLDTGGLAADGAFGVREGSELFLPYQVNAALKGGAIRGKLQTRDRRSNEQRVSGTFRLSLRPIR